VGCKDSTLKEIKFKTAKTWWFTQKTKKITQTQNRNEPSLLFKFLPNIFNRGPNDVEHIEIDNKKNLIYVLVFKKFDEEADIRPCTIEIFYIGPFAQDFLKVTSISQFELNKIFKKHRNIKDDISIQIAGLHHISLDESHEVDFMLVTSNGYRIYFKLNTVQYSTEKLREVQNVDYTLYYD